MLSLLPRPLVSAQRFGRTDCSIAAERPFRVNVRYEGEYSTVRVDRVEIRDGGASLRCG